MRCYAGRIYLVTFLEVAFVSAVPLVCDVLMAAVCNAVVVGTSLVSMSWWAGVLLEIETRVARYDMA